MLVMSRDLEELDSLRPSQSVLYSACSRLNQSIQFYIADCSVTHDLSRANQKSSVDAHLLNIESLLNEANTALTAELVFIKDLEQGLNEQCLLDGSISWITARLDKGFEFTVSSAVPICDKIPAAFEKELHKSSCDEKLSYRDIAAKPSEDKRKKEFVEIQPSRFKWEPKFVLEKTPYLRVDRKYGPQPTYVDEDEDLGVSDMIDSHYQTKAAVGLGRYRDRTMLTPAEMEKKAARIAEKGRVTG